MRNLPLLLLGFVLISNSLIGQTLVDTTKCWNTVIQGPPLNPIPIIYTETIKFSQDTVIDSKSYNKVLRSTEEFFTNWNVYCFIRETLEKEVYIRFDTSYQEYLLYDFGAEINDTLTVVSIESFMTNRNLVSSQVVVDSVDSVFFAEKYRKRINLGTHPWIEGIGCLKGILHNQLYIVGGDWFELVCYSENDTLKYQNSTYSSCYNFTSGISDITKLERVIVSPNPVVDKSILRIMDSHNGNKLIEIYDCKGVKIVSQNMESEFEILRADYMAGIYLYRVVNNGKIIGVGKFVIE